MARRRRRRRKRKNPDNTTLILLLAAGGAAGYYFLVHKPKQQVPVVAPPLPKTPGIADTIAGIFGSVFGALGKAQQAVEQKVAARGPSHVKAWKAALASGSKYYNVQLMVLGSPVFGCYETATGNEVAKGNCPVTQLEGLGGISGSGGGIRGTLSSRGYGSLR